MVSVPAELDTTSCNPKQLKAAVKEGGKKAQDVAGVADLGGLDFFCTRIDSAEGDMTLLRAAMDAMNQECDAESEERRGGAGHVGKMLVSSSEKVAVVLCCNVPEDKQAKLTAKEWIEYVAKQIEAEVLFANDGYAYAIMKYNPEKGHFPLKHKDTAISHSTLILRQKGFMQDDSDSDDEMIFGDDDFPSEEPAAAPAGPAPPATNLEGHNEKKMKAVIKEGGKKAQDVAGVADLGGLDFFCTSMLESAGNVDLLREQMDAMNAECDPESEERRGGAGHVGKMLISFSEKTAVALVCYVPQDKIEKLSAAEWIEYVAGQVKAEVLFASPGYAYAEMKYDPENGRFPLKERDNAISHSTLILRQKGFMPDDSDSDDEYVFGDDDFPSDEPAAPAAAAADPPPAADLSSYNDKKMKAVRKEGGKKAQDVAGVADLGGLDFFCTSMLESAGDVTLLREQMDAMNAECKPDDEERRGGAGHVGKMLVSFDEKKAVALVCYVPEDKQAKLTAKEWIEYVSEQIKAEILYSSAGYAYAEMKYDPEAGRFPLKERDTAISHSTLILRQKGYMPDDDSDDDEMVFGDMDPVY